MDRHYLNTVFLVFGMRHFGSDVFSAVVNYPGLLFKNYFGRFSSLDPFMRARKIQ